MACPLGKLTVNPPDPRINYNLLPGEKLMTCPYNKSHAILPIKFHRHVNNCRRLHEKAQQEKGQPVLFSICQWDRSHHLPHALLAEHEATCKGRLDVEEDWGEPLESAGGSSGGDGDTTGESFGGGAAGGSSGGDGDTTGESFGGGAAGGSSGGDGDTTGESSGGGAAGGSSGGSDPEESSGGAYAGESFRGGAAGGRSGGCAAEGFSVKLQEPPKLTEEQLAAVHTENWEDEPPYPRFDSAKRIHELRLDGYALINTHDIVGLTKSEKKEFYAKEEEDLRGYARQALFRKMEEKAKESATSNAFCTNTAASRSAGIAAAEAMAALSLSPGTSATSGSGKKGSSIYTIPE